MRLRGMAGVAAASLLLIVSGCGTESSSEAVPKTNGLHEVTMGGTFAIPHLGAYVAWKKGFFEDHGVKIKEYVFTAGGTESFQAVQTGNLDFGLISLETIAHGLDKGLDVRGFASISPEFYSLQVRKGLQGEVKSVADLKGRKIGVSTVGSGSWAFLTYLVKDAGLDPEKDVEIVQLKAIANIVSALKSGKVDASISWDPGTAEIDDSGIGYSLVDEFKAEDVQRIFGTPSTLAQVMGAKESFLKKNPKAAQGVVAGLADAYEWIQTHDATEIADVVASVAPDVDRNSLVASIERIIPATPKTPDMSQAAIDASLRVLKESGVLPKVPAAKDMLVCDYAKCLQ